MIFLLQFTLNHSRKTGIQTNYCPTWISDSKPDHNSGKLVFELIGSQTVELGETCFGTLYPFVPELWTNIKRGDILCAMEGNKQIGEGTITDVLQDWEIGGDYMPQEYK